MPDGLGDEVGDDDLDELNRLRARREEPPAPPPRPHDPPAPGPMPPAPGPGAGRPDPPEDEPPPAPHPEPRRLDCFRLVSMVVGVFPDISSHMFTDLIVHVPFYYHIVTLCDVRCCRVSR